MFSISWGTIFLRKSFKFLHLSSFLLLTYVFGVTVYTSTDYTFSLLYCWQMGVTDRSPSTNQISTGKRLQSSYPNIPEYVHSHSYASADTLIVPW